MAKLVEKVLNKVLEAEVAEKLQAGPYERSEERQGYRNGYREREMKTRIGTWSYQSRGQGTDISLLSFSAATSVVNRP